MTTYNPMLLADFYKIGHINQYPINTEKIYSTFTPRTSRVKGVEKVVTFGIQAFIKEYLIDYFNANFFNKPKEEVVADYVRTIKYTLGGEPDVTHIAELHDLGYLPIHISALPEGTLAPLRVPMLTIENTHPKFFWITNFLETLMSAELWQPMTSATTSYQYRQILDRYAMETVGNLDHVPFQAHDFSLRGMAGVQAGAKSGAGHLLSFVGTDTIPAIMFHEKYYGANIENELVGTSIPATEHSVMSANSDADVRDEFESFRRLIEDVYPNGFVSIVSDTYDFWKVVGDILPRLKDSILARDGKVVIRPDSGDPVLILTGKRTIQEFEDHDDAYDTLLDEIREEASESCGEDMTGDDVYTRIYKVDRKYYKFIAKPFYNRYDKRFYYVDGFDSIRYEDYDIKLSDIGLIESLWNIFGGTVNEKGYKELDSHIGAIYGDSITPERAELICKRLKEKGFASSNVVLGVGSYSMQYVTRDTFGFAMKATYAVVNGEPKMLFKDPKTDNGTKRSQRGRVAVVEHGVDGITYIDGFDEESYAVDEMQYVDLLEPVFKDGKLVREHTLEEIRARLAGA